MNTNPSPELIPTRSRRRWIWVLGSVILAVTLIGAVAMAGWRRTVAPPIVARAHDGAPRLVIDKEVIDLGAVPYRKMVNATFEITNTGREVLEVTEAPFIEIVKGCCPPSPVLGKKSLKQGEATSLSVSFMMYQGMGGLHDFRVHLRTNDPSQPDKTVRILSDWK